MVFKSFNRDYRHPLKGEKCLFCKETVKGNDSFKNVNVENGKVDYFHFKCFKIAVNNMIEELKKNEPEHGKANS